MVNIKDLCIGDDLKQKSTGRIGKYDGDQGHKVRFKVEDKIVLIAPSDLEEYHSTEADLDFKFDDNKINIHKTVHVSDEIDLHIEKLAPHLQHQNQAMILDHQLSRVKKYIELAIQNRKFKVLIIHGKGTGVLKAEVLAILKDYAKVRYTFDKNDGGATEVWLDL